LNLVLGKSGGWDKMDHYREEIIFARNVLQELSNRGVHKIPLGTDYYNDVLKRVKEKLEKESKLPSPLDTLLVETVFTGDFDRMMIALETNCSNEVYILTPKYEGLQIELPYKKLEDSLVKKFTEIFIEELNV
jgi:hypothetical protein